MDCREILSYINEERVVGFAQELVRIPSENPPGNEKAVAFRILERFQGLGLKTRVIEGARDRPNVLAELQGVANSPILLFNGHTDVVPAGSGWNIDPYGGIIKDGKLWGRGSCDMKGGLAAIMEVAEVFKEADIKPRGTLSYSIVVDEEMGGRKGTGFLVENGFIKANMALVAEPSNLKMSISEGGVIWVELITLGTRAHTISATKAVNAIEKMAKIILELEKLKTEFSSFQHPRYGRPILSTNIIQGGLKTNMVPDECRVCIDIRFPPGVGLDAEKIINRLYEALNELRFQDKSLQVKSYPTIVAHAFEQPEDTDIVRLVRESTKEVLGEYPQWWDRANQTVIPSDDSDVYHLWVKGRIPTIYFGPGEVEQAHALNEHIDTKQIVDAAKIYTLMALKALVT